MSKYRIQAVAHRTGLTSALIRAWEARYRLVVPERSGSGYRLYSDEDVALLQGAQRLVSQGMAPMQVAALPREEILRGGQRGGGPVLPEGLLPEERSSTLFSERIGQLIDAFMAFDRQRVEGLLGQPLATLPTEMACEHLLLPLLREVGERWHRGEVSVAAEHFGTGIVRSKLLALLYTMRHKAGPRRVVCACPPGEHHEIGLLMFALAAAGQGWDPIYLGADLPLSGFAEAVVRARPLLVGLSISQRHETAALSSLLGAVQAQVLGQAQVLCGGRGISGREDLVLRAGCLVLPASGRLDDLLGA